MINSKVSYTYDNTTVTKYATFGIIESFKKLIDFQKILSDCVQIDKHHNAKYQSTFLLELLIDAVILGITRFLHLDDLQNEPGFKKLKNVFELPSKSTIRDLLDRFKEENLAQLETVLQKLLYQKASLEPPKEVWIDYDDRVITLKAPMRGVLKNARKRPLREDCFRISTNV